MSRMRGMPGCPRSGLARLVVACAALGAISACSVLEPKPDTSRYFLLRSLATEGAALDDLVLGLGPVTVPDYLDRTEMLDLVGPYELRYSADNRWVEPLGGQIRRTLAENLRATLRPDAVVEYPWYATDGVALEVEVVFHPLRLDDDVWQARAQWVLRDPATARALERSDFTFELGRDAVAPDALAESLSEGLDVLSREIAAGVRRHHRGNR